MKLICFIISVLVCAFTSWAQTNVAVYVTGEQEPAVKKVLGSKMVTYITQSPNYTAVERTTDFLSALTDEHDYQTSGEVSNSQIVRLGQQFGARYVAVVDVAELYGELFASARLIDVQTSHIISSYESSGRGNSLANLSELANKVADGLILAPERKKQEQANIAEANKRASLRQKAIKNLLPVDAVQYGNYVVINRLIPVTVDFNSSEDISKLFSFKINGMVTGFEIADVGVIEYLCKNTDFINVAKEHNFIGPYHRPSKTTVKQGKEYTYDTRYWKVYNHGYISTFYWVIGRAKKEKGVWTMKSKTTGTDVFVVLYRLAPSESEIQAEINRLLHL